MENEQEQERIKRENIARQHYLTFMDNKLSEFEYDESLTEWENHKRFMDYQMNVFGQACGMPKIENENNEPKSEMAQQLKALLDNMSQEEFDSTWNEITALELKSVRIDEYAKFLKQLQAEQGKYNEFWETLHD